MSFFGTVLASGKKVAVPIEAGHSLTLASVTLDTNKKSKGSVQVRAKPSNFSSKDGYILGVLSNDGKKSSLDLNVSFDENNGPLVLWIVGNGKVHVVGTQQSTTAAAVKPVQAVKIAATKKSVAVVAADPVAPVVEPVVVAKVAKVVVSKKRKVEEVPVVVAEPVVVASEEVAKSKNQSYKKRKSEATETTKEEGVQQINMKKVWKVKPQNDEGVLVEAPKPVFRLKGLSCTDYVIGKGAIPHAGAAVKITYTGLLPDGTVFDSRMKRLAPFVFRKGVNQVVKGLDLGMEGMKIGGSREISIPPELGYGKDGMGKIPANQTLIFRITLLA